MKVIERILDFLSAEKIDQIDFCKKSGLNPSTFSTAKQRVSEVKESVIINTKKMYPNLSLNWLVLGLGDMYEKEKPASINLQVQNNHTVDSTSITHEQKASYGVDAFGQCQKEVEMLKNTLRDKEEIIFLLKQKLQK